MFPAPLVFSKKRRDQSRATLTMLREQRRIESEGVLASRATAIKIRKKVLQDFKAGRQIDIGPLLEPLVLQLRNAQILAHLIGLRRSQRDAPVLRFALYDKTIADLAKKQGVSVEELKAKYGEDAAKVYKQLQLYAESQLTDVVREILVEGLHTQAATARLSAAFANVGLSPGKPWQIESLYRTQTAVAYEAGRWEGDQDPAIQEILWGYEYVTVGDDRVRPTHEALDGTKLPKDDIFWRTYWPPNGWNCRCVALPVYVEEAPKTPTLPPRETKEGLPVVPDKGFAFNPGIESFAL